MEAIDKIVEEKIEHFKKLKKFSPGMYEETMWSFAEMSHGGSGGEAGSGVTIRDHYYKNYPDVFFFRVLSAMKEYEKYMRTSPLSLGIP